MWLRAAPIFVVMMAALLFGQLYLTPRFPGSPIFANGGLGLSLICGILGAFLISRFATSAPPPTPSKTQQRKLAASAARPKGASEDEEEEGEAAVPVRSAPARRRRRRR
ncbi:MAG TPA: hypothetical protein VKU60_08815 [Chloroflexota bacterium]|nr:hypothetical protein [Chloroflexota bacterium]